MSLNKHKTKVLIFLSSLILTGLFLPLNLSVGTIYLFILYAVYLIKESKKISLKYPFIILCLIFFSEHLLHYFLDIDKTNSAQEIIRKLGFIFIPILYLNLPKINYSYFINTILSIYKYAITALGLTLILVSIYNFYISGDFNVFFYHQLASIFNGSAIYYSLLFTFSLIISFEHYLIKLTKQSFMFIAINSLIILFLSSKVFGFLFIILFLFYILKSKVNKLKLSAFFILLLLMPFLFKGENMAKRFSETNFQNIFSTKSNINQSTTFDGFSFRKEMIKIGLQISSTNKKTLLFGIGPGDTQNELNKVIVNKGFYIGNLDTSDKGFLNYNFHNQYIQTLVETGVFGLFTLLLIISYLIRIGFKENEPYLLLFNVVFLISFLTESVLSRQVGIFSFLVFNSILVFSLNKNNDT